MAAGMSVVRTTDRIADVERKLAAGLPAVVGKLAVDLEAIAKQRAPYETGHLRNSIQARPVSADGLAWEVVAQAHYAIYVEMGTRYMAAQPFMGPAAEAVRRAAAGIGVQLITRGL